LWHQPLYVFARHRSIYSPGPALYLALAALSVALAYLTWRYVEQPFRQKQLFSRRAVFTSAAVGTVFFLLLGGIGQLTAGRYGRSASGVDVDALEARLRINFGLSEDCEGRFTLSRECRAGDPPEVLVWGDSFAMHVVPGLLASAPGLKLVQMTVSACGPLLGVGPVIEKDLIATPESCIDSNDRVIAWLRQNRSVKTAVLSTSFRQYAQEGAKVQLRDGRVVKGRTVALQALDETLAALDGLGVKALFIAPTPQNGENLGRCLARATQFGHSLSLCDFNEAKALSQQASIFRMAKEAAARVPVIWPHEAICGDGICRASIGDVWIYRDAQHLSYEGSAYLGKKQNWAGYLAALPGKVAVTQ
jgi:hypothetical protein